MIAADQFQGRPEGLQRGRGGFLRSANDVPYVSDPSGVVVKSGARKGEVKRLAYSSTSGFGTLIENRGSLEKWSERKAVEGLLADPSILARVPDEFTAADLDRCVVQAKQAARAWLAADRGTHVHTITEHVDTDREWSHLLADGAALDIDHDTQRRAADAWAQMRAANGLEVLAVETAVVDDEWRCAGTLDRVVRCTRDLTFARKSGEVVTIPAGTVVVLDIKPGSLRLSHSIQIASYAASVPYDTEAETRGEWDHGGIDRTHALIAHLNIEAGTCELVYVDIAAARSHGGAVVVAAKDWERRTDVFSVAQIAGEVEAPPTDVADPGTNVGNVPAATPPQLDPDTPADEHAVIVLQKRYERLSSADKAWIMGLAKQAAETRPPVPFTLKGARNVRRFEIMRALVLTAEQRQGEQGVRELLSLVVPDAPMTTPLGAVIGSLSAAQAATFARIVDGSLVPTYDDGGRLQLIAA